MYKVLYRAKRPETFKEMLGQKHIVKILKNQIEADRINHAYLFCGTRGTGKTTTARLLAKGVNCLSKEDKPCGKCENCKSIKDGTFIDIVEIDAASNNGIENIRELKESVKYPPAVGRRKVYIIDEVHMLSTGAFNAFLKMLEEPPEYVTFVLATTEPHKLPQTILSRCMRLDFRRIPESELKESIGNICKEENVEITEDAINLIVMNADGSARDGLTLLDQCISARNNKIDRETVLDSLGAVGEDIYLELTEKVLNHNSGEGLLILEKILSEGKDPRQIIAGWMSHYRNLLVVKFLKKPQDLINMSLENIHRIREQADHIDIEDISSAINELAETMLTAKWSTQPRILLELVLIKLAREDFSRVQVAESKLVAKETMKETPKVQEAKEKPNKVTEVSLGDNDFQSIWKKIIEEGIYIQSSFSLLDFGARPIKLTDTTFVLEAGVGAKPYLEKYRSLVEDLFEKHSGKKLSLEIIREGSKKPIEEVDSLEKTKKTAQGILGIEIEEEN